MSSFGDMIKEAFVGLEAFDALPGRADLERAIENFDRRERTARWMTWMAVTFMSLVVAGVIVSWYTREATSVGGAVVHLGLFIFAMTAIGMMKSWLVMMQNHVATMRELKRTQIMLLESRATRS